MDASTGSRTRLSFHYDYPPGIDIDNWYPQGQHNGLTHKINLVRYHLDCHHRPCMTCEEDTRNPCTCDFRGPQ